MLDLTQQRARAWPAHLRPIGEGTAEREHFVTWWARHEMELRNLHPDIARQWVYRHWMHAHFKFLELNRITWTKECLPTTEFLGKVHLVFGGPADPEHDFAVFMGGFSKEKLLTAQNWCKGTWTIAPLVLWTPNGIKDYDGSFPNVRMVIIEGSKRYRWLNALHSRGEAPGLHDFYLLNYSGSAPSERRPD